MRQVRLRRKRKNGAKKKSNQRTDKIRERERKKVLLSVSLNCGNMSNICLATTPKLVY